MMFAQGDGVAQSPSEAFSFLERAGREFTFGASDLANAQNQGILSRMSSCGGVSSCPQACQASCAAAVVRVQDTLGPALDRACKAGHAAACYAAGTQEQFIDGVGRVSLRTTVKEPKERACALGLGLACSDNSRGCALQWGPACRELGFQEQQANHSKTAMALWEKACALGVGAVCTDLEAIRNDPGLLTQQLAPEPTAAPASESEL
jgi:TPR repeat protein